MLTNEQMKAGRFLRLQKGKRKLEWIKSQMAAGRTIYVITQTRVTKVAPKHSELFRMDRRGSLYLNRDCIDFCGLEAA